MENPLNQCCKCTCGERSGGEASANQFFDENNTRLSIGSKSTDESTTMSSSYESSIREPNLNHPTVPVENENQSTDRFNLESLTKKLIDRTVKVFNKHCADLCKLFLFLSIITT
jgi:hypothetical protein